jgi:pseudouridylate synthase
MPVSPATGAPAVVELGDEVAHALARGDAVVALESTIISHGLPRPRNHELALALEGIVRDQGACPATIAVIDGTPKAGLNSGELERVAFEGGFRKLGLRDLALAMASSSSGATTVSATAYLAAKAGIRVFATGGLGGVHRGWTESWDESADLEALARTKVTVVCSGAKSVLDVPATLQRLETLNVPVLGFRCREFPGFYLHSSGERLDWWVEEADQVATVMSRQDKLGVTTALVLANPVPLEAQLDPELHDRVLTQALEAARADGVGGQALTPYLLARMFEGTAGASLEANVTAVKGNAALASRVATAWADGRAKDVADGRAKGVPALGSAVP